MRALLWTLLGTMRSLFRTQRELALENLGIEEVVTAVRLPWQNAYAERLIGSLRRESLDHVIILDAMHLRRMSAEVLPVLQRGPMPFVAGRRRSGASTRPQVADRGVIGFPEVGSLHHRYERVAA